MLAPPGVPGPTALVGSLARAAVIATLFQLVTAFCAVAHGITSKLGATNKVATAAIRLIPFISSYSLVCGPVSWPVRSSALKVRGAIPLRSFLHQIGITR